jgi:hypothetical protein
MLWLNVNWSCLRAVLPRVEIGGRAIVRVIETETGRPRRERNAAHSVCRDEGRPFFLCAVNIRRDELPVPVELLRCVRIVVHVDGHPLALFETKQRPGELTVVGDCGEDVLGRDFDGTRFDAQRVVR